MTQLHNKYRPTTLNGVIGQDHIIQGIKSAIEGAQQAFLFEGPSGTGKTTLARICASQLGCTEVIEVDAATHTGVDAMREVADRANYISLDGGKKAFIIDEAHRLSKQAWESLLKDIEEPPQGIFWFFCTTEGSKVPKTIRTRCVSFALKDVPWRKLLRLLSDVAASEAISVPEEVLDVCAATADGSPRKALVNLAAVSHCKTEAEAEAALNRISGSKEAYDLAKLIIRRDFNFSEACKILNDLKDSPPESIRQTVRAYATTTVIGSPDNAWARGVLMAFIEPSIEQNQISDILQRIVTLEKWKRS